MMKRALGIPAKAALVLGTALALATAAPAQAQHHSGGGHWGGGGGWHSGGRGHWGGWRGGYWGGWHGRGWGWGPAFSFGWYGPLWVDPWWPGGYYYPYPAYPAPPAVYAPAPASPDPLANGGPPLYQWPTGITSGICDRTYLSQAAGGLAGASVSTGPVSLGGLAVGPLVGGPIGVRMDAVDQACVMQTLELGRTNVPVSWTSSSGLPVTLEPVQTYYRENGQPCRDYRAAAKIGGKSYALPGTACRAPDGSWVRTKS